MQNTLFIIISAAFLELGNLSNATKLTILENGENCGVTFRNREALDKVYVWPWTSGNGKRLSFILLNLLLHGRPTESLHSVHLCTSLISWQVSSEVSSEVWAQWITCRCMVLRMNSQFSGTGWSQAVSCFKSYELMLARLSLNVWLWCLRFKISLYFKK